MVDKQVDGRPAGNFLAGLLLGGGLVASAGGLYYLYSHASGSSTAVPPSVFGRKSHENYSGTNPKSK